MVLTQPDEPGRFQPDAAHSHLVMETPEAHLVAGMRWLLSSGTLRLNHRPGIGVSPDYW
jgi:hypothetical protein